MKRDEILEEEKMLSKKRMPDMIRRMRILYIKDFLEKHTNEERSVSMWEIIKYLEENEIPAERKSVRDDILALKEYGMDIDLENGKQWKLLSRDFDLDEIKLIADCVASSRILTAKKSQELIKKLGNLVGISQHALERRVIVTGRAKAANNQMLYNVDTISEAIAHFEDIEFRYFQFNMNKERKYKHDGKIYHVYPRHLIYENNIYYLLADERNELKTFRVDRMSSVTIAKEKTADKPYDIVFTMTEEEMDNATIEEIIDSMELVTLEDESTQELPHKPVAINMSTYMKSTFGMYHGEETQVTMLFKKEMMDTVIDRFGEDVKTEIVDEEHFRITEKVAVSPQFYGWIFGLGDNVMIEYPLPVAKQMMDMLKERHKAYRESHTGAIYSANYKKKSRG